MFFIILGNLEPRPQRLCCSAPQRAVRDAGCPGNTCGSAALHALPRAAARRGARHRGGGNLRGDRWQKRSAVDGWTAAGGGPAVHVRAVLLLIWKRAPSRRRRGSLSCCRPLGQRLLDKKGHFNLKPSSRCS